jgi:hypothetical protein
LQRAVVVLGERFDDRQRALADYTPSALFAVIPGRAPARTRNLEIPGSMLCIAPG